MGLSLFKFVQFAPKDASFLSTTECVLIGRSRSFKVIQGRYFGTNRKRVRDFLLVRHWSYLAPFLRYGELFAKITYFFATPVIRRPRPIPLGISR